jgi:hypothetical protein
MAYDNTAPFEYLVAVTLPDGYTMSVTPVEQGTGKQEVTVSVKWGGRPIYKLVTWKTNW